MSFEQGSNKDRQETMEILTKPRRQIAKKRRTIKEDGPHPIDIHIGSRMRARRVGLSQSQTKLGNAIGLTFQQIQKYENGANRIGGSNLYLIAKALDVSVGYFFVGLDKDIENGTTASIKFLVEDPMATRDAIEIMHNFYRIKEDDVRDRVKDLVKSLARFSK